MSISFTILILIFIFAIFLNIIRKETDENQKDESDEETKDPSESTKPDEEIHLDYEDIKERRIISRISYEELIEKNIKEIIEYYNTHRCLCNREMIIQALIKKGASEILLKRVRKYLPIIWRREYGLDDDDIEDWR